MTTDSQRPAGLEALFALAKREVSAGHLAEAAAAYRKILTLSPDSADAHNNLGNVLMSQCKPVEAAAQYGQAVALRPGYSEAHYNLGNALQNLGKLDEAAAQYAQAVALKPGFFQAINNLGNILREQGQLDQAVARYEQAVALRPDYATAHKNLGNALTQQGKFERALASYDQSLVLRPDYAEAHYHRTDLKTFRAGDPDLVALEAIAANPRGLAPAEMAYIHFALGKALEDLGDYPRAFEHWIKGNALKRREIHYDEAACERNFRLIAERFDSRLFDRFPATGDPSPAPIFVLGMPRSGSTLVEQILASHPQIHAAGELTNLDRVANSVSDANGRPILFPHCLSGLDAGGFRRLGQAYLASLPTLPAGKTRIIDKLPMNFAYVGLIRLILPNARIIHTLRDPVDTCVSCFSRLFASGQLYSYDLAELGRHYRWYHELMAHWRSVLPIGVMLDVSYEDVIDNLEGQARRLIDYCGLPWDDRCLSFHETSRPIATHSNVQVRQPLYRSSVARWRRYEACLQPLLAELGGCRP